MLVTGGTRGIGKSICREFARAGFDVALTGRTLREGDGREEDEHGKKTPLAGSLDATAEDVSSLGVKALPIQLDLLDAGSVDEGALCVLGEWGGVDVLVNNAMYEMGQYTNTWIKDTPMEEFSAKVQANFLAPMALVKHFLPGMIERGGGRVINLSTRHNYTKQGGPPGAGGAGVSYNCSKAACGKIADGLAAEHDADGILCFDLDPGPVMTERFHTQGHRLGYPASLFCPVEVPAMAALWLATKEEAKQYNGQHFMAQEFVRERRLHPEWESTLPMNRRWSTTAILDWRESADKRYKLAFLTTGKYQYVNKTKIAGNLSRSGDHQVVVVLATDGQPNSCPAPQNDTEVIAGLATAAYNYNGVETYVIAIQGSNLAALNSIAAAGNTGQAIDVSSDISAFLAAMETVRNSVLPDEDGDGLFDPDDNCPSVANVGQEDQDADCFGDVCDDDIDGDGTLNASDAFPLDPSEDTDTDSDGLGNNADLDDDGDGLGDWIEVAIGFDPLSTDSNENGTEDGNDLIALVHGCATAVAPALTPSGTGVLLGLMAGFGIAQLIRRR